MKREAGRIAALGMLMLNEAEKDRLEGDLPEIFALTEVLSEAAEGEDAFEGAVGTAQLREDVPVCTEDPIRLMSLSKLEKDGYLHVVRTVG